MQTEVQVVFDESEEINSSEIKSVLEEINDLDGSVDVHKEQPKGIIPTLGVGESLTLIIAISSTVDLLFTVYPEIRGRFSEIGGETHIMNVDQTVEEYIEDKAGVTSERINLVHRSVSGNVVEYTYEEINSANEYYVKIDRENIEDLEYEVR